METSQDLDSLLASNHPVPFRATRHHVHSTWARTFRSLPELYIQPESVAEIQYLVNLARRRRRRVVVVGAGHSPSELTCTSGWMVNLDNFSRILSIDTSTGLVAMEAGIRLGALGEALDQAGLAMASLGSIDEQSIAGAISTGTHGSSLYHGLLSEDIVTLSLVLADGTERHCSAKDDPDLFRAALVSLGALGIITKVTLRTVPAFVLRWKQVIDADAKLWPAWKDGSLWNQAEFVRVWWVPYTRRAITWSGDKPAASEGPVALREPPQNGYNGTFGYHLYHNLLYLARWFPSLVPWVEWLIFGLQFGFTNGSESTAVQPSRKALLLDCLYSQFVNEWAIPLQRGPEALMRLGSWLNRLKPGDPDYVPHGIPFNADGVWAHAPVEVRVSDSRLEGRAVRESGTGPKDLSGSARPFLDPTSTDGPTLYLNAILYRPYGRDPPGRDRYYAGFEWLMRDLGGRPHWAKNFEADAPEIEKMFGEDLVKWRKVRERVDPDGMFLGSWHRTHVMPSGEPLALEEREISREIQGAEDSVLWSGLRA